jgi:hypothetical protein
MKQLGLAFLEAREQKDAPQAKMTTAEVMSAALVSTYCFDEKQERISMR